MPRPFRKHGLSSLVLFLLCDGGALLEAQTWIQLNPTGQIPPALAGVNNATAPYDAANNRLIVFGGGFIPRFNGVWVLSNANGLGGTPTWTQLLPIGALIPQRSFDANVYDPVNNRLIVFGGVGGSGDNQPLLNDTWVLTNANGLGGTPQWIQLTPTGGPPVPSSQFNSAAYDSSSNRMIIFGGCTGPNSSACSTLLGDAWVLTNANGLGGTPQWIKLAPTGTVQPRRAMAAVYDGSTNRFIVFGGQEPGCDVAADVAILTNANGLGGTPQWSSLGPIAGSLPNYNQAMAYDSPDNSLIVFGGVSSSAPCGSQVSTNYVWNLSGANGLGPSPAWTQLHPSGTLPIAREGSSAAYDQGSNRLIVFGGGAFQDTWVLTNANGVVGSQLQITQVLPNHGGNSGTVTAQIIGSGFQSGATVTLTGLGPDILGTNNTVPNASAITTTFDLRGATPGVRNVVVTNPDNTTTTLTGGFTVEQGGAPQLWVDIIGRDKIRIGTNQAFYIAYGNSGNVDVYDVVALVHVPKGALYSVNGILPLAGEPPTVVLNQIGLEQASDMVIPIWFYRIPAGSSGSLPLTITAPDGASTISLRADLLMPPLSGFTLTGDFSETPFNIGLLAQKLAAATIQEVFGVSFSSSRTPAKSLPSASPSSNLIALSSGACGCAADDQVCLQECTRESLQQQMITYLKNLLTPEHIGLGISLAIIAQAAALAVVIATFGLAPAVVLAIVSAGFDLSIPIMLARNAMVTTSKQAQVVASLDPNDKAGSQGVGTQQYISGATPLRYAIQFGNEPAATAPAQKVNITDQLDFTKDDATTLSLGPVSFGSQVLTPPPFQTSFSTTVDLRPATNLLVAVNSKLNPANGLLTWNFQSLDPATGLPPTDPTAGFLPPGGNGSVFFTVNPKQGLPTNTQIQNQATIVFDVNAPINTPTWLNTLDNTPPTSKVSPLSSTQTQYSFPVQWSGTDVGSGIQDFTIYVSDNGGAFTAWLPNAPSTQATYNGVGGHTYSFYSIARDLTGNVENAKTVAEATTKVVADTTPPVIVSQITGTFGNSGWYKSNVGITWSVTDPESGIASSSGCTATTLSADTAGVTLTCSATNGAGLSASVPVTIKIDQTPPIAIVNSVPTPNGNGWNNTSVTVSFTGSDNLSGIDSCTASITFTNEGAGQVASGTCIDKAGNVSAPATAKVNIDKTPPVSTATPAPGVLPPGVPLLTVSAKATVKSTTGATLGTIAVQCFDTLGIVVKLNTVDNVAGSGVATLNYAVTGAQTIASTTVNGASGQPSITAPGLTTITFAATDAAGNRETTKSESVLVGRGDDRVGYGCAAPTPTFVMPAHGKLAVTGTVTVSGYSLPFSKTMTF